MVKKRKVAALIPSRLESQRFPNKPLADIFGKPLIQRVYEQAKNIEYFDEIYVATDHEKIASLVTSFGGNVIMTSKTCKNGTERIAEAVQNEKNLFIDTEIIVNIQGDHPLFSKELIEKTVSILEEDQDAVMATAATSFQDEKQIENPNLVKCVIDQMGNALYFSRAAIASSHATACYHHVGVYAYRTPFLNQYISLSDTPLQGAEGLEQLKVLEHGYKMKVALVKEQVVGIDTMQDLKKMEDVIWQ